MFRIVALLLLFLPCAATANATEAGWALLRDGGHVVLIRHAQAPGNSDPANFDIEKCNTQRNLSDRGRQQARRIGALIAARAAPVERVLTSRYCRCTDTAKLAFGDRLPEQVEALDLITAGTPEAAERTAAVMADIEAYSGSGNLVLITHLENIVALTGIAAREGEAIIVRPDGDKLHVLGRILFN